MKDKCREIRSMFDRFLDGELPPGEESRLREHVEACEMCRIELQGEQEIAAELGSLPELQCPENLLQGIREALRDREGKVVRIDKGRSPIRAFRWRWVSVGLAAAIAAYILIGTPGIERGQDPRFAHSPETIRRAQSTAKWSLAYAAVMVKNTEIDAIESVFQEHIPSSLRKGLQSTTQSKTGGLS